MTSQTTTGSIGLMEKATVSRLKNNLSAYLRKLRASHPVVVYERIEAGGRGDHRLALLKAPGMVRPPTRASSIEQWRAPARRRSEAWHEIVPGDAVQRTANRLLCSHALRAGDCAPPNRYN